MNSSELHRRDLLKLFGGALSAELLHAQHHSSSNTPFKVSGSYKPRFLSTAEYEFTTELSDLIIPSDELSAGAKAAGVPWFIDTVLLYAASDRQQAWRSGLISIDALAVKRSGKPFLECSPEDRVHVLEELAHDEELPQSAEGQFFGELKALTVQAFCLSEIGMRDYLRYRGNTVLADFPGCEHGST